MTDANLALAIKNDVREKIFAAAIDKNKLADILAEFMTRSVNAGNVTSYRAAISQAGTGAQTEAPYLNTIGTLAKARTGLGVYTFTSATAKFTALKTVVPDPIPLFTAGVLSGSASFARTSTTVITMTVLDAAGAARDLGGTINDVEFTVYS